MRARVLLTTVVTLVLSCGDGHADTSRTSAGKRAKARAAAKKVFDLKAFERTLAGIESTRRAMGKRYRAARTNKERLAIRTEARAFVVDAIQKRVFGPWMGTPWSMGRNSTSTRPHQPGMTVGCSYFVTSVLLNAGLRLSNRYTFAQAPALYIQRSLAPKRSQLHRFLSIPASSLKRRIQKLGDGLYIIGLHNHVGFVVVKGSQVRFVHSSVTTGGVTDEALQNAMAIHASRSKGYFLTPIFQDRRLIDYWLRGKSMPFQSLGY